MRTKSPECNTDLGHPRDADDGGPCESCSAEARYWRSLYAATPADVRRLDYADHEHEIAQELRDAGRI